MTPRRLLIVDDESALLGLMKRYLTRAGFEVDACGLGADAWRRFDAAPHSYSAVIVDLSLPDITGYDLIERMRARFPALRVVICSGSPAEESPSAAGGTAYLQKPFLPKMLLEVVERVTGGAARGAGVGA